MTRPDMREVSRLLAERIEDLAMALLAAQPSMKDREEWRWGTKGSLAVVVFGDKRGQFFDHEVGQGGDAIDLICHLRRCSRKDAWLWAVAWLGQAPEPPPPAPARTAPRRPASDLWGVIWSTGRPAAESPVERYLASRGLELPAGAPLRFHAACPRGAEALPAMLALMVDPETGKPCGVHRTYLQPDGSGKADVSPAKMMLGDAGVMRLVPDEEVATGLGIAEGIETSLAIMQHTGWAPVWATGSAGGIARFPVLAGIEALTIWADHDLVNPKTGKRPGLDAADKCAARWYAAGRTVTIQSPPEGTDWLDALGRAA